MVVRGEAALPELTPEQHALIESHLDFARKGASKYARGARGRTDRGDFVSAAYVGLVAAARKYDPHYSGASFSTFAFQYIDRELKDIGRKKRRQEGWSLSPTNSEKSAGHHPHRMVQRVSVCSWPTNEDGEPMDIIGASEDPLRDILATQRMAQILAAIPDLRDRHIMWWRLKGESFRAIGKRVGLSGHSAHEHFCKSFAGVVAKLNPSSGLHVPWRRARDRRS